jgi:hypothetical protein
LRADSSCLTFAAVALWHCFILGPVQAQLPRYSGTEVYTLKPLQHIYQYINIFFFIIGTLNSSTLCYNFQPSGSFIRILCDALPRSSVRTRKHGCKGQGFQRHLMANGSRIKVIRTGMYKSCFEMMNSEILSVTRLFFRLASH